MTFKSTFNSILEGVMGKEKPPVFDKGQASIPNVPDSDFDPNLHVSSCMMFSANSANSERINDYVFGDEDYVLKAVYEKRVKKMRKKHPEYFECLDIMDKKAYPNNKIRIKK